MPRDKMHMVVVIYETLKQVVENMKKNRRRCDAEMERDPKDKEYWKGRRDAYTETMLQIRVSVNVMEGYFDAKEEAQRKIQEDFRRYEREHREKLKLTGGEHVEGATGVVLEGAEGQRGQHDSDNEQSKLAECGSKQHTGEPGEDPESSADENDADK